MDQININDLKYKKDLFKLAEAMQYAFHGEATSEYSIQNKRYWLGQVYANSRLDVVNQIKKTKEEHAEALAESPLLNGLLDMYVAATSVSSPEELKAVYEAYQSLQKDCTFEDNKQAYVDAGCTVGLSYDDPSKLTLKYPIFLYGAYELNGGADDDHRGGYLYPVHILSEKDIEELRGMAPELFEGVYPVVLCGEKSES